jgi:NIPSNAP.
MKKIIFFAAFILCQGFLFAAPHPWDTAAKRSYYELRIYHFGNADQQKITENFLEHTFIHSLHKWGVSSIGIFKPVGDDTAADKKIYVLIPYSSLNQFENIKARSFSATGISEDDKGYINAAYNKPAFTRIESVLLKAFENMPAMAKPALAAPRNERVYELRSYESASEALFHNKVEMFNKGGEIEIFKRLGFNAVFYSEVVSGSHMPNLMYMTSFENKQAREEHWKGFSADEAWKKLSALPQYQNNVSHIDITFLRPTAYSDF